jgi:hypothetical protein
VNRELLLIVLLLTVCGPILLAFGALPALAKNDVSGRRLERGLWEALWVPLLPAALAFAGLLGWAIQEPDDADERLRGIALALAAPFAAIWIRAIARSAWALLARGRRPPIATVGLLRPRVVVAPFVRDAMDAEAFQAACEHEAAHARHRDPLRIWLAQLAADLQWPWPSAKTRLRRWLWALEVARDEQAREHGAEGADLAAAILTAITLAGTPDAAPAAALTGDGAALKERIGRLLTPVVDYPAGRAPWGGLCILIALSVALMAGLRYGDLAVRALPGVLP